MIATEVTLMTNLRSSLGKHLRKLRKDRGFTLAELVKRSGLSLGYISQLELGKNTPSIDTLKSLSTGLGVKISEIFSSIKE